MTAAPDAIAEQTSPDVARAIRDLWVAALTKTGIQQATDRLAQVAAKPLMIADLLGRADLLKRLPKVRDTKGLQFSKRDNVGVAPTFDAAIEKLLARSPVLVAQSAKIPDIMRAKGIAFAKAAALEVTKHAQEAIATAIREGESAPQATQRLMRDTDWPRAYAQTAYRTVALTSYADGMKAQATDPNLGGQVVGWEYAATMDSDTRPNHAALDGVVASIDDPIWDTITPPCGFNCRCTLIPITAPQAKRRFPRGIPAGRIPAGGGPDPGFK